MRRRRSDVGRGGWWWVALGLVGVWVMSKIPEVEADFVARWEGYRAKPYRDIAGHWTIGYGSEMHSGESMHAITEPEARARMVAKMESDSAAVDSSVKVPLSTQQHAALVDFVYNLGSENLQRSTLLRLLNAGDYHAAAEQFRRWDMYRDPAGRLVQEAGLLRRRLAERDLFLS